MGAAGGALGDASAASGDAGAASGDAGAALGDAGAEPHVHRARAAHAGDEGVPATNKGLASLPSVRATHTAWPEARSPRHLVRSAGEEARPPLRPTSNRRTGPGVKAPVKRKRPDGSTYRRFLRTALRKPDPGAAAAGVELDRSRLAATLLAGRSVPCNLDRM